MRLMMRLMKSVVSNTLTLMLVILALAAFSGKVASRLYAQTSMFRLNSGVTIRQKVQMAAPGKDTVEYQQLVAFRKDGSRVTARQIPRLKSTPGFHERTVVYPELGRKIIAMDAAKTKSTFKIDPAQIKYTLESKASRRAASCVGQNLLPNVPDHWKEKVVGHEALLGVPVVKLYMKGSNNVAFTAWVAPSLDCTELATRAEFPDGAVTTLTTTEIVNGDPDPALFNVDGLVESGPVAAERKLAREVIGWANTPTCVRERLDKAAESREYERLKDEPSFIQVAQAWFRNRFPFPRTRSHTLRTRLRYSGLAPRVQTFWHSLVRLEREKIAPGTAVRITTWRPLLLSSVTVTKGGWR